MSGPTYQWIVSLLDSSTPKMMMVVEVVERSQKWKRGEATAQLTLQLPYSQYS